MDPFDQCVQGCFANMTFVPQPPVIDQSLAVCKKQLRITPAESGKTGAAWYAEKQRVRSGFNTSFAFRIVSAVGIVRVWSECGE